MNALIAVNAPQISVSTHPELLAGNELVIAVDGGAAHLERLGLTPHIVLGDFDSIAPPLLEQYRRAGVELRQYPAEKDATDLELALELARERGITVAKVIGAAGGRLVMGFANILAMASPRFAPMRLRGVDDEATVHILHPTREYRFSRDHGRLVSLMPLQHQARGITLKGFRYPLDDETMSFGSSRGISNELTSPSGTCALRQGVLLAIQQRG